MKINKNFVKQNSELLNKLRVLEEDKLKSNFINYLNVDGSKNEVSLSCKYTNGNKTDLTPKSYNNGINSDIDLKMLQKELVSYTKNFIKGETNKKIMAIKTKLVNNGVQFE